MSAIARPVSRRRRIASELKELLSLAAPIMIAQLATTAMGFVDAVMAGRVGPRDLAAVALGNSIWIPVFLLMTGTLLATTAKVAQRFGAGDQPGTGPLVRQALWLALLVGPLAAAVLWFLAEPVLRAMKVEAALIEPSRFYLRGIACGLPAVALYHVLRCFSDGLGRTRPSMVLGLCGLLLNIPLNYVLIYGHLGFPALGGPGCGWATASVMWFMLLGMLGWVNGAAVYRPSALFSQWELPDPAVIRRLVSVGLPIGIAVFAESSIFSVIALLIGELGEKVVAGHQVALNFSAMAFMIPYALAMAVTVRVGQALGAGAPRDARFSAGTGMAAALAYACVSATAMLLLREQIAALYTRDPQVLVLAASLLVFSALFQFSDALQVTAAGALRGYQDTRAVMLITLFAYWGIGLPVGYSLGLAHWLQEPSGPRGLWQGLIVGLTCAAAMLGIRLARSARRHIRLKERRAA
ncbi:MATE family efflux transporter [Pseudomonas panipatensis]|uniref:Multidrug-efflux transporter n=1 Tax=Pseudomonas panipatensis TaxID=428992 RepID=A0A1G8IJR9_9PSED|nr:MATE family efflux transporter [Pseudomonas panipatensis]SDI19229.1 multidrug resistance protein, MATE family [Pseudomonas panipatensis]SMP73721.1 multidrug resistance protein, MATE family [Pseudomonas panipatensis]